MKPEQEFHELERRVALARLGSAAFDVLVALLEMQAENLKGAFPTTAWWHEKGRFLPSCGYRGAHHEAM